MKKASCSCEKCKSMCLGYPGWFLPGQAKAAATHLGMSLREFFSKYLIVEYWVRGAHVLAPKKLLQPLEKEIAKHIDAYEPSPCRLLGENGCLLDLEHRPIECSTTFNCKSQTGLAWRYGNPVRKRDWIQRQWGKNPAELRELFGETYTDTHP